MLSNYPLHILKNALYDLEETLRIIKENANESDLKFVKEKISQLKIAIRVIQYPLKCVSGEEKPIDRNAYSKSNSLNFKIISDLLKKRVPVREIANIFNTSQYQIRKIKKLYKIAS